MSQDMMERTFKILDDHGRFWGVFTVKKETNYFGSYDIHGTLIPSSDFEMVRPLFIEHELKMEEEGDVEEVCVNELLELNPYLVDDESGERFNINGALFITEKLLVTCGVERTR